MGYKKYYIFGGIGLLFCLAVGAVFYKFFAGGQASLLSYIGDDFGQVVYIQVDDDVQEAIASSSWAVPQNITTLLNSVDAFAIHQKINYQTNEMISYYLVEVKKDISIDQIKQLMQLTGDESLESKWLGGSDFIVWLSGVIDQVNTKPQRSLIDIDQIKPYIAQIWTNQSNIIFISKADTSAVDLSQFPFANLAKSLEYAVITADISKTKTDWKVDLLFKEDLQVAQNREFKPLFDKFVSKDTTLYLETTNFLNVFWVDVATFQQGLKDYLSFSNLFGWAISDDDANNILQSINWHLWLVVGQASNQFGIGASVFFEKNNLFSTLQKFYPYLKEYKNTYLQWSGAVFSWIVTDIQEENRLGFSAVLPFFVDNVEATVVLEKVGDYLALKLLDPVYPQADTAQNHDYYDKNTLITFRVTFNKLIQLYNTFAMQQWATSIPDLSYFDNKILNGNLTLDSRVLHFIFKIE